MEKNRARGLLQRPRGLSPYDQMLLEAVMANGGFYNAHAHLDRADTLDSIHLTHINTTPMEASILPLSVKQNMTGNLHLGVAYTEQDLRQRMTRVINRLISYGTVRISTCIDATPDIGEGGLLAIRVALELKEQFAHKIKIEIAPNPIFGFKEGTDRDEVFVRAAEQADFLSALPEKDDYSGMINRDGKIGFEKHLRRVIGLGCELHKQVHIHLDQANDPNEKGTETLLRGLPWIDQPLIPGYSGPTIWVIHMISPSAYSEERFARLVDGLIEHNVGVIVCPTAAISMRQLRPIESPTHNSIARVLELCKRKVPVRIGTDNICDVFVPQGDGDMLTELKMLGHAVRLATPHVWAKLAAGVPLNEVDIACIERVLNTDRKVFLGFDPNFVPAVS